MLFLKTKEIVASVLNEPRMGNTIKRGRTQIRAIPNPLVILPFKPRKENISFGFITTL